MSDSVVMLSLKYIAKLLEKSPHIQGAEGSEYRLFIVALLLGKGVLCEVSGAELTLVFYAS